MTNSDKERDAVRLRDDLREDVRRECFSARHSIDHEGRLVVEQAGECHLLDMGAHGPWRGELGTKREHGEEGRDRRLVDNQTEQLERRSIRPLEVFDDQQHRLASGSHEQGPQDDFECLSPLLLGRHVQRCVPLAERYRK